MKNKFRDSKGVVSVFAMLAMLFFLLFIIGAYMGISRLNKMQKQANRELIELYSANINPQDVYNSMVADKDDVIPVYEYSDLPTNTARFKLINGKIYYLTKNSSYELKSTISLPHNVDLYENIHEGELKYSNEAFMSLMLDGDNNSGTGHVPKLSTQSGSIKYAVWRNLLNLGEECNIYSAGTNRATASNVVWGENSLVFGGSGMYVLANDVIPGNSSEETIEVVFKTANNTKKQYIFSNANISVGIAPKTYGGDNSGVFFVEYEKDGVVVSKESTMAVAKDRLYHVALTFNGKDISLYVDGNSVLDSINYQTDAVNFNTVQYKVHDNKFALGLNTYIGTPTDPTVTGGITISPYFVSGYSVTPSFRKKANGADESYVKNNNTDDKQYVKDYYINFSNLNKVNDYTLYYALSYENQNANLSFSNIKFGASATDEKSLSVVARGSNSVIIRSNVGKISNWYCSKDVSTNFTPINPTKEVQVLGKWYYSFENLKSNNSNGISYWFKGNYNLETSNTLSADAGILYIGRRYDKVSNDSLLGEVCAVRVYEKALTSDNIQTNYKIDKTKYGIY